MSLRGHFRLWHGMALDAWLAMMRGNWHRVPLRRYPLLISITLVSAYNLVLKGLSRAVYRRRLAQVRIEPDPVFVIGHWRSGTTWLHQILIADPAHVSPTSRECFLPEGFLIGHRLLAPVMAWTLPEKRPMDNVGIAIGSAEEDEIGLLLSGAPSPMRMMAFPGQQDVAGTGISADELSEKEARTWRRKWLAFLRSVQLVNPGKRLVLKSPGHTMRLPEILARFPNAKFVHIVRDPYRVYLSSMNSRPRMSAGQMLLATLPPPEVFEAAVLERYEKLHDVFLATKEAIPEGNIVTVRYEDLRADTMGVIRKVYEALDLGEFAAVAPYVASFAEERRGYRTNCLEIAPEAAATVRARWAAAFERYGYDPDPPRQEGGE